MPSLSHSETRLRARVVALGIALVLIQLAAAIHTDPRPFVVDPSIKPLFAHAADNGFPSDHAVAATVALLVMTYRKMLGAVLLAASILVQLVRTGRALELGCPLGCPAGAWKVRVSRRDLTASDMTGSTQLGGTGRDEVPCPHAVPPNGSEDSAEVSAGGSISAEMTLVK